MARMFSITIECTEERVGGIFADLEGRAKVVNVDVIRTGRGAAHPKPHSSVPVFERMFLILHAVKQGASFKADIVKLTNIEARDVNTPLKVLKLLKLVQVPKGSRGHFAVNTLTEAGKKAAALSDLEKFKEHLKTLKGVKKKWLEQ